jgi:hypothetical protein
LFLICSERIRAHVMTCVLAYGLYYTTPLKNGFGTRNGRSLPRPCSSPWLPARSIGCGSIPRDKRS